MQWEEEQDLVALPATAGGFFDYAIRRVDYAIRRVDWQRAHVLLSCWARLIST